MTLTIQIERQLDDRWKASFVELPGVSYVSKYRAEVEARAERLQHALRSPHVRIDRILPDGDVILTLSRSEAEEEPVRFLRAANDLRA